MKSIFEIILDQIRRIPYIKEYYSDNSRHADFYDHVFTGVFIMLLMRLFVAWFPIRLAVWLVGFGFHALFKELWLDREKNEGRPLGKKVDLTTRIIGWAIGALFLI